MKICERIIQAMNLKHTKSNQTLHLYKDNWVRFEFNYRIHIGQWIITHNASLNNGKHSQSIQLAMEWLGLLSQLNQRDLSSSSMDLSETFFLAVSLLIVSHKSSFDKRKRLD